MTCDGNITLQDPVDFAPLGQFLQEVCHGRKVAPVLIESFHAAPVQLDGPLGKRAWCQEAAARIGAG